MPRIYDDAAWHRGEDWPQELPAEASATHSGLYLAWALFAGLGGDPHVGDSPEELKALLARRLTPGAYLITVCDGRLTSEDLSAEGNDFTKAYFDSDGAAFFTDYREYLAKGLPSEYHVADSWSSFDKLAPVLDRRLANWRRGRPEQAS